MEGENGGKTKTELEEVDPLPEDQISGEFDQPKDASDEFVLPYRYIKGWKLVSKKDIRKCLPLPIKTSKFQRDHVILGWIQPANHGSRPLYVELAQLKFVVVDRTPELRGYWVETPLAYYWLQEAHADQDTFEQRVTLAAVSTILSVMMTNAELVEKPASSLLDKVSLINHSSMKITEDAWKALELSILKKFGPVVARHLEGAISGLGEKSVFIRNLRSFRSCKTVSKNMVLEWVRAAEIECNQYSWGGFIMNSESPQKPSLLEQAVNLWRDFVYPTSSSNGECTTWEEIQAQKLCVKTGKEQQFIKRLSEIKWDCSGTAILLVPVEALVNTFTYKGMPLKTLRKEFFHKAAFSLFETWRRICMNHLSIGAHDHEQGSSSSYLVLCRIMDLISADYLLGKEKQKENLLQFLIKAKNIDLRKIVKEVKHLGSSEYPQYAVLLKSAFAAETKLCKRETNGSLEEANGRPRKHKAHYEANNSEDKTLPDLLVQKKRKAKNSICLPRKLSRVGKNFCLSELVANNQIQKNDSADVIQISHGLHFCDESSEFSTTFEDEECKQTAKLPKQYLLSVYRFVEEYRKRVTDAAPVASQKFRELPYVKQVQETGSPRWKTLTKEEP